MDCEGGNPVSAQAVGDNVFLTLTADFGGHPKPVQPSLRVAVRPCDVSRYLIKKIIVCRTFLGPRIHALFVHDPRLFILQLFRHSVLSEGHVGCVHTIQSENALL